MKRPFISYIDRRILKILPDHSLSGVIIFNLAYAHLKRDIVRVLRLKEIVEWLSKRI